MEQPSSASSVCRRSPGHYLSRREQTCRVVFGTAWARRYDADRLATTSAAGSKLPESRSVPHGLASATQKAVEPGVLRSVSERACGRDAEGG